MPLLKAITGGDSESTRRRTVLATSTAMFALFNAQPATAKLKGRTGGIPIENFRDLPGAPGIKYYDIKGGGGDNAVPFPKGTRVAVHYDLKFRSLTIASSRVGAGVTGGSLWFQCRSTIACQGGLLYQLSLRNPRDGSWNRAQNARACRVCVW